MRSKFVFALVLGLVPLFGHATDELSSRQVEESRCLVQTTYRTAGTPDATRAQREAVVKNCVSFDQGIAAWLKKKSGPNYDTASPEAQASLAQLQKLADMYLMRALFLCSAHNADETACLKQLKLNLD